LTLQILLIADKTLAYDAALLTLLKELHLIIQQQLLDFWGSLYGKAHVMLVMQQQREIMCY
jgi:hypothetical protein